MLISVYGPGPSCTRLGTFSRRGRSGENRLPVSGSLFGRPLPPGRYAIVVDALRRGERVRIGRVLVTILARDGREGGSRPLAAPACSGTTTAFLASAGGAFGELTFSSGGGAESGRSAAGGVAGVSAGGGDEEGGGDSLLPQLPALPAIPSLPAADSFDVPPWTLPALAILGALGAAALVAFGFRRYRENAGDGWD